METVYEQELARDLKRVRELARTLQKAQRNQKKLYDQRCKEVKLKVSDLEPRFHLNWSYKGSFVIRSLSTTNANIQLKDDPTSNKLNFSRQRLPLCSLYMSQSIPWVEHSGKLRNRL